MDKKSNSLMINDKSSDSLERQNRFKEISRRASQSKNAAVAVQDMETIKISRKHIEERRKAQQKQGAINVGKAGMTDQLAVILGSLYMTGIPYMK